jgi:hypothetical protein
MRLFHIPFSQERYDVVMHYFQIVLENEVTHTLPVIPAEYGKTKAPCCYKGRDSTTWCEFFAYCWKKNPYGNPDGNPDGNGEEK